MSAGDNRVMESDEALVRQSQAGNRAAFEQLVRRSARLLYARLYLDIGDRHRTEDLVQETFLIAWRSIGQVTDASGFRPWLLAIGRTAMLDAQRRNSRKKRTAPGKALPAETMTLAIDPRGGPDEHAQQMEQREQVLELLRRLPEEYRTPLMLRYFTGADYDSISQQLGLSNGSLRGLLNRGMAKLREGLIGKSHDMKRPASTNEERQRNEGDRTFPSPPYAGERAG